MKSSSPIARHRAANLASGQRLRRAQRLYIHLIHKAVIDDKTDQTLRTCCARAYVRGLWAGPVENMGGVIFNRCRNLYRQNRPAKAAKADLFIRELAKEQIAARDFIRDETERRAGFR